MDPSEAEAHIRSGGRGDDEGWETVAARPGRRDSEASQRRGSEASHQDTPADDTLLAGSPHRCSPPAIYPSPHITRL